MTTTNTESDPPHSTQAQIIGPQPPTPRNQPCPALQNLKNPSQKSIETERESTRDRRNQNNNAQKPNPECKLATILRADILACLPISENTQVLWHGASVLALAIKSGKRQL